MIDTNKAFPLMRWMSGAKENLLMTEKANKMFFKVKPKFILSYLHFNKRNKGFIRYPKKAKNTDETLEILRPYIKKLYQWSDKDIEKNKIVIDLMLKKEQFVKYLNDSIGLDKADAKKFGINTEIKKQEFKSRADLFSFGG